jgi:hypothetical protein
MIYYTIGSTVIFSSRQKAMKKYVGVDEGGIPTAQV